MPTSPTCPTWNEELGLDASLRFQPALSAYALAPRRILLTGATGFLGAFVLDELLRAGHAEICCLVRGGGGLTGAQRLRAHLTGLGLTAAASSDRVRTLDGDLAQPLLGLTPEQFAALAAQVDVIFHIGGQVNFLLPYHALRATNVLGTQEILRLAGTGVTKPVHFTSTLALFFGGASTDVVDEQDALPREPALKSGYAQSKWAAERLLLAAQARGLPLSIYRTARITGHSQTGATSSSSDLLNRILRACITLGTYPALDIQIVMLPVDYVSRTLVHLSGQARSLGRAFHLSHPEPCPFSQLMNRVGAAGYPLAELPYAAWLRELKQAATGDRLAPPARTALAQLWTLLHAPNGLLAPRPRYETPNLAEGLHGSGITCPPIDAELVRTYLSFFQASGYLPRPLPSQQTTSPG